MKVLTDDQEATRTLEKINRDINVVRAGSKRHTRLGHEKTRLESMRLKHLRELPDR